MPDFLPGYCWARGGLPTFAYNETAFRHFLSVDRARARSAGRALYLVLVDLRADGGGRAKLSEATAMAMFSGLAASVREVDFIGWYEEGRVAAAVLAQGPSITKDVAPAIAARIAPVVKKQLPDVHSPNVRIRVVQLGHHVAS